MYSAICVYVSTLTHALCIFTHRDVERERETYIYIHIYICRSMCLDSLYICIYVCMRCRESMRGSDGSSVGLSFWLVLYLLCNFQRKQRWKLVREEAKASTSGHMKRAVSLAHLINFITAVAHCASVLEKASLSSLDADLGSFWSKCLARLPFLRNPQGDPSGPFETEAFRKRRFLLHDVISV